MEFEVCCFKFLLHLAFFSTWILRWYLLDLSFNFLSRSFELSWDWDFWIRYWFDWFLYDWLRWLTWLYWLFNLTLAGGLHLLCLRLQRLSRDWVIFMRRVIAIVVFIIWKHKSKSQLVRIYNFFRLFLKRLGNSLLENLCKILELFPIWLLL